MTDNNISTDFLDIDTSEVDTSPPALAAGEVLTRIDSVTVENGKKNPSDRFIVLTLKTIEPANSTKGQELSPGFPIFYRLALQNYPGSVQDYTVNLAKLSEAAFGEKRRVNSEFITALQGCEVLAVIKLSKNPEYGESEVARVKRVLL